MAKLIENLKQNWTPYILITAVLLFILNVLILYYADDYCYAFIFPGYERIIGFWDIAVSMKNHWLLHGGRIPAHVLASFFMLFKSKLLFNVLNTGCYILLCILIVDLISVNKEYRGLCYLLTAVFCWLFNPGFGQTFLWLTGACNYLWLPLLEVLTVWIIQKKKIPNSIPVRFLVAVLFFTAGWGNENLSFTVLLLNAYLIAKEWNQENKSRSILLTWLLCMLIGYVLLIAAPGNFNRMGNNNSFVSTLFQEFSMRFNNCTMIFMNNYIYVVLLFAVALLLCLISKNKMDKTEFNKHLSRSILYFVCAIFCNYVMIASPYYPERASIGTMIFLVMALMTLCSILTKTMHSLVVIASVAAALVFGSSYVFHAWIMLSQFRYETDLISKIESMKEEGIERITVESSIHTESSKYGLNYNQEYTWSENPDEWMNQYAAKYYGVQSISVTHNQ